MKILLPVDGSEVSLEAVRHAISLVRQGLKARMVLANVQEPAHLYELVMTPDPGVIERASADAARDALLRGTALLREADIPFETEIAIGDPAHTIVDIVERYACGMVILGARDKGSLRSALLGSVAHEVLHAAPVPVMIIKPRDDADLEAADKAELQDDVVDES